MFDTLNGKPQKCRSTVLIVGFAVVETSWPLQDNRNL